MTITHIIDVLEGLMTEVEELNHIPEGNKTDIITKLEDASVLLGEAMDEYGDESGDEFGEEDE